MSDFKAVQKYSICVTTSKAPIASSSSVANTEAAQILCPHTWSASSSAGSSIRSGGSSLKVGAGIGIQSLARYPSSNQVDCHGLYLAYAGSSKDNMHAMLLSSGESDSNYNSAGSLKWKCRLPEVMEAGLHISPHTPHYVFGGGVSGRAYVWSTFQSGSLLKTWQAHYRPVTAIAFSSCGGFFLTGGADGVVNLWSYLDLVSQSESDQIHNSDINPIHTWSDHHLPISALYTLPSNRAISVSLDRYLIIMELFNGKTIARILLPSALTSVTSDQNAHRLYAGAVNGTIYCIDMDSYAITSTAESATVLSQANHVRKSQPLSISGTRLVESILSTQSSTSIASGEGASFSKSMNNNSTSSFISEFRGHKLKVTALIILEGEEDLLISGGEDGTVRVWDIRARCCTCIIRPWTSSNLPETNEVTSQQKDNLCPVSSIIAIPMTIDSSYATKNNKNNVDFGMKISRKKNDIVSLISPLQRFQKDKHFESVKSEENVDLVSIIAQPTNIESSIQYRNVGNPAKDNTSTVEYEHMAKRYRLNCSLSVKPNSSFSEKILFTSPKLNNDGEESRQDRESDFALSQSKQEIKRLKIELEEANALVERWQKVNTKLVSKLKKANMKK